MKSDYEKLKEELRRITKERNFLEIDNDNKDSIIRKQKKEILKLEKELYQYKLLLIEKIKEELW